ncbi:MAG: cytochrome c oxidase accessory protein CcoG [Labrys sp. (in: a-proteobacteria)]
MSAVTTDHPPEDDTPLYEKRREIYPQAIKGRFRTIKWALMAICLGVYYFLPFLRWDRGPNAPDQAVLIDFPERKFYFFFVEIWPQELYYVVGLLILAAVMLFLMNAVAGRLWCGYLCPQTVWTDLFFAVERFVEGDRRERMKKHGQPLTARRVGELGLKHFLWLMIAWWTGGAWVLYFADAPTLVWQLATLQAPMVAYLWIGILTATTYLLAGFAREQVCLFMCPWPRIQAALTDEEALNVTYRYDRGEPRMSVKRAEKAREQGQTVGDCVECDQCIAVCPTGIDIRQGPNLGCIQCGLCIDACDRVMEKINRPAGLIAYDTDKNIKARQEGRPEVFRPIRPRTILYAAFIVIVGVGMLYSLLTRNFTYLGVLHDRNPLYVQLSDGQIRNAYTINISNKKTEARDYVLTVEGLPGASVTAVGAREEGGRLVFPVGPGTPQQYRVFLTAPADAVREKEADLRFTVTAADGEHATARDEFHVPHHKRTNDGDPD